MVKEKQCFFKLRKGPKKYKKGSRCGKAGGQKLCGRERKAGNEGCSMDMETRRQDYNQARGEAKREAMLSVLGWECIRDLFSVHYCTSLCWRLCLESSGKVCLWNYFILMIEPNVKLECVPKFCYLGDTLGAREGVEEAARARVRCAWAEFKELSLILTARGASYRKKGKVYKACVQNVLQSCPRVTFLGPDPTQPGKTLTRPDPQLPTKRLTRPDPRPDPSPICIVFNLIIIY